MASKTGDLILIPWHIGSPLDVTLSAVEAAERLRLFLAEDPELTRRQFESDLRVDCSGKEFWAIPEEEDEGFLDRVRARLLREDAGLISSGGTPCFIDPGAWIVRRLREKGQHIKALAGASILSAMLSLSGFDWPQAFACGTFAVFDRRPLNLERFQEALRRSEPLYIFLSAAEMRDCLAVMEPWVGDRPVTAFFDLTKGPEGKFPYAGRLITFTCREWKKKAGELPWDRISDVSLLVGPEESRQSPLAKRPVRRTGSKRKHPRGS